MTKIYKQGTILVIDDSCIKEGIHSALSTPVLRNGIHYLHDSVSNIEYKVGKIGDITDNLGYVFIDDDDYYLYLSTIGNFNNGLINFNEGNIVIITTKSTNRSDLRYEMYK